MVALTLSALSPYDDSPMFVLRAPGGRPEIVSARGRVADDIQRWLSHGLVEWAGRGRDAFQRVTPSDDPAFLGRLSEYLTRSYGIRVVMADT